MLAAAHSYQKTVHHFYFSYCIFLLVMYIKYFYSLKINGLFNFIYILLFFTGFTNLIQSDLFYSLEIHEGGNKILI